MLYLWESTSAECARACCETADEDLNDLMNGVISGQQGVLRE
jgi:hypothetical protein